VKPTEQNPETPTATRGFFATLRGLLRTKGTGAPKTNSRSIVGVLVCGVLAATCLLAGPTPIALAAAPEAPETLPASSLTNSSARLNGIVNPNAKESDGWFFQYNAGTTCTGGSTTPPHAEEEVEAKRVSAAVTGLAQNTTYTACLVAENAAKELKVGNAVSFTTGAAWWGLTSGSQPTNLQSGLASNEVQEVTISATSGDWMLGENFERLEQLLPFNASARQVQERAETALPASRAVRVSGGPVDTGTGDLPATIVGKGNLTEASATVTEVMTTVGAFAVGQVIEGAGIPLGTTIEAVNTVAHTLTLKPPGEALVEKSGVGVTLTVAGSKVVEHVSVSAGAFVPGQEILGNGIPPGTKVEAVDAVARTLTLSQPTTVTERGTALSSVLAPYLITFPAQRGAPLVKAETFPGLFEKRRCGFLEEVGFGSCGGEPATVVGPLEGGAKKAPEVTKKAEGQPDGQIVVTGENRGDAATTGKVTIADQLPPGLEAVAIAARAGGAGPLERGPVECVLKTLTCTFEKALPPFEVIEVIISVVVKGAKSGELNAASVSGGGAPHAVSTHRPIEVNGTGRFGFEDYQLIPESPGGSIDTQAGSHPFQLTSVLTFNSQTPDLEGNPRSFGLPKDLAFELPPGFIGNPTSFAQCTDAQFAHHIKEAGEAVINECPPQSAIGVETLTFNEPNNLKLDTLTAPIFNMVPRKGEPARFAFLVAGAVPVFIDTSVRTGRDYGVTATVSNIIQVDWLLSAKTTFWGVPGDVRHDKQRGWVCLKELGECPATNPISPPPFLVMPTSCGQGFETTMHGDSWSAEGRSSEEAERKYGFPNGLMVDGCNHLPFDPSIIVTPDGTAGSSPTGLNVDVHVPQTAVLNAESLAESNVKGISVTLPEGIAVNPSGGNGLAACSEGLVGYLPGESTPPEVLRFTPTPKPPFETMQPGINACPGASKVGTVRIVSPLLPKGQDVTGAVYLATQNENPFGSLIALYIVAEDPVSGTLIKLVGETHLTESGQLIGTFKDNPQLAFEDAELHFFGGERAPLATPAHCGPYTTSATFTPWSGEGSVSSTSTFNITTGPNGSACPGASLPFSPSLKGGSTNLNAGAFTSLTGTFGREDGEQQIGQVRFHLPPGLSGLLTNVKLCPEAQANNGTCGPESLIGETTVSAGVGSDPISVTGGKVYITEKYHGAPFGLSVVDPVKAGPFDLERDTSNPAQQPACDCIVVRAKIEVDPHTAALTVTTNSEGEGYAIPHLIDGIPVQLKRVNFTTTRSNFQFNPTNCAKMAIAGTATSAEGASLPVEVPFQVTNCAVLKFEPKFEVSTSGKTSKAKGASLAVKLSYPSAPFGSEANIASVKVDLPKQLPSRLTTLQKACTAAQFAANPAGCPAASIVGRARALVPNIPVPLEGPAYFVSNGGEAFPNLIMVLQGYGVTIDLVGDTFISKAGITSSTFKAIPDNPVSSFELNLPKGKFSALAANANLCDTMKTKTVKKRVTIRRKGHTVHLVRSVTELVPTMTMPTTIIAQNGARIEQKTKINVTSCAKHRTKHSNKKTAKKANKHRKK
jgi:hypothetical protein